jgi:hypothetical protein
LNRIFDLRNQPRPSNTASGERDKSSYGGQRFPDPYAVAFITCVNDETQYQTCLQYIDALQIPAGYTVEKIAVLGAPSMAEGYQRGMEASTARYKIYVHQDVFLVHRGMLHELLILFETYPRLGMVGANGATQLPPSGLWWVNNAPHSYGRVWVYVTMANLLKGFSLSPAAYRRRPRFIRMRSFVGDYMPAVTVDGQLMATQYDLPWRNSIGGFHVYDQVQSLEFIKAGLEVGIARQEIVWCFHYGPSQELPRKQRGSYNSELDRRAAAFRQQYQEWIGLPAQKVYDQHLQSAGGLSVVADKFGQTLRGMGRVGPDHRPA